MEDDKLDEKIIEIIIRVISEVEDAAVLRSAIAELLILIFKLRGGDNI